MEKPLVSLALIQDKTGRVLAVSRKNDFEDFGFPGGKADLVTPGGSVYETPIDTLKREVYEETGLYVANAKFLTEAFDNNGYLCKVFVCDYFTDINYFDPVLDPAGTNETGVIRWMEWPEFLKMSKSHPEFNTNVFEKYTSICNNPNIVEGGYYMHKRSGEAYQIDYISDDRWVMLRSSFTARPVTMPLQYIENRVRRIPRVIFEYSAYRTADMEINPGNYSLAERAKVFAIGTHNAVHQDYDDHMYSKHLCDVVDVHHKFSYLIPAKDHDKVESALWNHDIIEDARMTFNNIKDKFGEPVAEGAYAMTNEKGRVRTQRANKKYYDGLLSINYGEYKKLCDRIANVSNGVVNGKMLSGYKKEQQEFKNKLKSDPVYQPMWDYLDNLLEGKIQPIQYHEQYN